MNGYPSFYPRIALVAPSPVWWHTKGACSSLLLMPKCRHIDEIFVTAQKAVVKMTTSHPMAKISSKWYFRVSDCIASSEEASIWKLHRTRHRGPCLDTIPNSQISQSTCPLSHNTTLITEMCRFLFWLVHCGIRDRCIVKLVFLWRAITTRTSSALAVKFNIDRNFCVVVVMIP